MVQAVIDLAQEQEHIVQMVKAQHGFRNKTETMNYIVAVFGTELHEPEIRPEYLAKLKRISAGPHKSFDSVEEMIADLEKARREYQTKKKTRAYRSKKVQHRHQEDARDNE